MYLGDPELLQRHLNDDWSTLLKNIRLRQDLYYDVLRHNKRIISKQQWQQETLEMPTEQTTYWKGEIARISHLNCQMLVQQKQIAQKYEGATVSFEDCIKLMGRVGGKVIEVFREGMERTRMVDGAVAERYNRMKVNLVGLLSHKQKMNLQHVLNVVLDYAKGKFEGELLKFQRMMNAVQDGQFQRLRDIYYQHNQSKRMLSQDKLKSVSVERKRDLSWNRQERGAQMKRIEKIKRLRRKNTELLSGVVQLAKLQAGEECFGTVEERTNKLYQQLLGRNRRNIHQITSFFNQEQQYERKIKLFQQNMQKMDSNKRTVDHYSLQLQSKILADIPILTDMADIQRPDDIAALPDITAKKGQSYKSQKANYSQFIATQAHIIDRHSEFDLAQSSFKQFLQTRTKHNTPLLKKQDFPQIFNRTLNSKDMLGSAKFEKGRQGKGDSRGRLPDISRGVSWDNKTSSKIPRGFASKLDLKQQINNMEEQVLKTGKKKSQERSYRDERLVSQRTKLVLKSVQVGTQLSGKREDCRLQQVVVVKERKKTDTSTLENTMYARRTLSKFMDSKFMDSKLNVFF